MRIRVRNLALATQAADVRGEFEQFGAVSDCQLILDRETGRPFGSAFVEMPERAEGLAAIEGLDGRSFGGRILRVEEAPTVEREPRHRPEDRS
jgi:RNA recognition motif-containing protein